MCTFRRRVRTRHRPRPEPRNHRRFAAAMFLRQLHLRIQMADAFLRLVTHPLAVVTNILGQSRRTFPRAGRTELLPRLGVHRRFARKLRRDFNERLVDEHWHGIQIARVRLQSQPLRLQRNRTTAAERVVNRWRVAVARTHDLGASGVEHALIVRVLPLHQLANDFKQPFPLNLGDDVLQLRLWSGSRRGNAAGLGLFQHC